MSFLDKLGLSKILPSIIGEKNISKMAAELYHDGFKQDIKRYLEKSKPLLEPGEQVNIFITWDETKQDFFYNIVATQLQGLINSLRPLETKPIASLLENINFGQPEPRNPEPTTRNPQPATRNPQPEPPPTLEKTENQTEIYKLNK